MATIKLVQLTGLREVPAKYKLWFKKYYIQKLSNSNIAKTNCLLVSIAAF